jgi:hypothetical protein
MVCVSVGFGVWSAEFGLPVRLLELSANNGLLMALTRQEESTRGFQILSLWLHCVMC